MINLPRVIATVGVFNPHSPQASAIVDLFYVVLGICAVILLIVSWLVFYSLIKYRHRPDRPEPSQVGGHKTVEIIWTLGPLLIVIWIFVLTARGIARSDPSARDRKPDLVIIGHQWWWEARYAKSGVVVANEIHIPVGEKWLVEMDSADVIHCFWVPELARKMDMIAGHPNFIWLEADQPGVYEGDCAEYCGVQHAWMRFQVIAHSAAEYAAWGKQQAQPGAADEKTARGARIFQQLTCVNCHAIGGTGARMRVGPDLTHVASRRYLGAGILENNATNLAKWLKNPQKIKPGILMANPVLTDAQVADLTAYFETLK